MHARVSLLAKGSSHSGARKDRASRCRVRPSQCIQIQRYIKYLHHLAQRDSATKQKKAHLQIDELANCDLSDTSERAKRCAMR